MSLDQLCYLIFRGNYGTALDLKIHANFLRLSAVANGQRQKPWRGENPVHFSVKRDEAVSDRGCVKTQI